MVNGKDKGWNESTGEGAVKRWKEERKRWMKGGFWWLKGWEN